MSYKQTNSGQFKAKEKTQEEPQEKEKEKEKVQETTHRTHRGRRVYSKKELEAKVKKSIFGNPKHNLVQIAYINAFGQIFASKQAMKIASQNYPGLEKYEVARK